MLRDHSNEERLNECGLKTLKMQRLRGDQILNGHEKIDPNIIVKINTGKRSRGHDFTLVKGQSRLDVRT